jgi:uncharacterized cupin superfamily protein
MTDPTDVFHDPATFDDTDPPGFRAGEVLPRVAGRELIVRTFELPAGETLCPYHYEFVEEWLLVLDGELDLRTPQSPARRLATGALICFPSGPEGAHSVTTPSAADHPTRLMMFSSAHEPAVAVYPDSDKMGVFLPGEEENMMLRRADGHVGYYDGEG